VTAAKWAEFPVLAFDTETTGVDVAEDRIVTVALIELHPGLRPHVSSYVVDPGIDIPEAATEIHDYTRARAIAEATHTTETMLAEITGRIALWLQRGKPLVGMNASYDLSILEAENTRNQVDGLVARLGRGKVSPVVDVLVLDKFADPYRKGGRRLEQLCATYGVVHTGAHDAGGDALAAARLWPRIMAKHSRKFPGHTLPSLHQAQVGWRREQADGLRAYFDKNGIEHDGVCPEWPLHEACLRDRAGAGR
jgi:DNA polymerase-3 subunit epsilon